MVKIALLRRYACLHVVFLVPCLLANSFAADVTIDFTSANVLQYTPQNPLILYGGDNVIVPCPGTTFTFFRLDEVDDYTNCNSTCTRSRVLGTCHAGLPVDLSFTVTLSEMLLGVLITYEEDRIYYFTSLGNCAPNSCEDCGEQVLSMGLCANNLKLAVQVRRRSTPTSEEVEDMATGTADVHGLQEGGKKGTTISQTTIIIIAAVVAGLVIGIVVAIVVAAVCACKLSGVCRSKTGKVGTEELQLTEVESDGPGKGHGGSASKKKELNKKNNKSKNNSKGKTVPNGTEIMNKNKKQADGAPDKKKKELDKSKTSKDKKIAENTNKNKKQADGAPDKKKEELDKSKTSKDKKIAESTNKNKKKADGAPDDNSAKKKSIKTEGESQDKALKNKDNKKDSVQDTKGSGRAVPPAGNSNATSSYAAKFTPSSSSKPMGSAVSNRASMFETPSSASTKPLSDKQSKSTQGYQANKKTGTNMADPSSASSMSVGNGHSKEKKPAAVTSSECPSEKQPNGKKPLSKAPSAPPANKQPQPTKTQTSKQIRDTQHPSVSSSVPPSANNSRWVDRTSVTSSVPTRGQRQPSRPAPRVPDSRNSRDKPTN